LGRGRGGTKKGCGKGGFRVKFKVERKTDGVSGVVPSHSQIPFNPEKKRKKDEKMLPNVE